MDDRFNTIAGWTLFAGIVALGGAIFTGEIFHSGRPEKMGFPIEGVVEEGAGGAVAVVPIAALMATADVQAGQAVFAKCAACHTINKGGATGIGPNLWGTMGAPVGHVAGFAYSDALTSVPGAWTFEGMNEWVTSPRKYAPGTKMSFAGLSSPEDRANLIVYLNSMGSNLPLPAPVEIAAEEGAAPAEGEAPTGETAADAAASTDAAPAEPAPAEPAH